MRKNVIPAIIAFAPALLLPLVQDAIRPRVSHSGLLGFVLNVAPDFIVGCCFPFSILVRPRAWTAQVAAPLFRIWSVFTVVALVLVEILSPFGPNVFDVADIVAGVVGVAMGVLIFHRIMRYRLTYAEDEAAQESEPLASE